MKLSNILLLFFLFNSSFIFSVNNKTVDSLLNVIENNNDTVKYEALIKLAKHYYYDNKYYYAIKYINQAIKLIPNDTFKLARANNFLGVVYYHLGDYPTALNYNIKSLKYREKLKDERIIAVGYNSIAITYTALGNLEKSNYYLQKALAIEKKYNNIKNIAMIYNNISDNYSSMKQYDKALELLLKSEEIIDDTDLDKALLLINIGDAYKNTNQEAKAKEYYFRAIDYCKKTNNKYYLSLAYQYIGELFLSQKDYKQALFFFYSSMQISKEIKANDILKDDYKGIINVYSVLNSPDSVLKYNNLYYAINDSIFNKQAANKIAELQIKYDFDKKEQELKQLRIQKELDSKKQKILIISFISVLLIIIIIFLMILNRKRKKYSENLAVKQNIKIIKYEDVIDNSNLETKKIETPKDTNTALSEEFKTMLEVSISKKIRKEKLYLKNDFNLNELAQLLGTNRRYVSQVINERFEKNFNSFINEFRINEAMRLMSNPDNNKYTIEAISKKVGFNSMSAFISAFKKNTGVTPSAFMKSLKK